MATKSVANSVATKSAAGKSAAAKAVAAKSPVKKVKEVKDLSEQELLKASDKEYMNEAQLAFFKQRLLELRGDGFRLDFALALLLDHVLGRA